MDNPSTLGFVFTLAVYVVGALVFWWFSRSRAFDRKQTACLLFAGLAGGVLGAKLTRLLFAGAAEVNPLTIVSHPDGRTIIGGILFGWLAIELTKKRLHIERSTGDGFALALAACP
jgi:prolipoprotein diacylglyceryltransferase